MSSNATPRVHAFYSDSHARVVDRKVWEDWPGYHYFFCDGRFMLPKPWKGCLGTAALIIALEGLFVGLVAIKLDAPLRYIAMLSGSILAIFAIFFLFSTCLTDPGVLPRLQPSDAYLRMQLPRTQEVAVGDRSITIRYDDVYHYYRPPRAHHCRALNVVVMRFDHFCPWTGNTIGERNYRAFVSFLACAFLALSHAAAFCALHIARHLRKSDGGDADGGAAAAAAGSPSSPSGAEDSTFEKLMEIVATPVVLVVVAAFILAVGGLLGFHISLIARGLTTYESIESFGSTFSEGCCNNCRAVWCTRMPPAYMDFTLTLRAAQARQPPAVIRMVNPHLSREAGGPGGSSGTRSSHTRSGHTPRREHRDRGAHHSAGLRAGDRVNGGGIYGQSPRRLEGSWVEYVPRAERPGPPRWEKRSPRGNGHLRPGEDAV